MNPENINIITSLIDKIPTILTIILSSTVSIITLVITYKTGKRQNTLNLITSGRIEWQETVRKELANFIGDTLSFYFVFYKFTAESDQLKRDEGTKSVVTDRISKIIAEGNRLILRLNPTEDAKIIEIIKKITTFELPSKPQEIGQSIENLFNQVSELVSESHNMLKKEWEKIKIEAGHKKFKLKK
jgi:hypothetical protein